MFLTSNSCTYFNPRNRLLLIVSLLLSMEATAQNLPDPPLENESPATYDRRIYADSLGISIEEANQRFELRKKIGDLEEKLKSDNPDTFAGLWLEHTPEFRLVAQFAGQANKNISTYLNKELIPITEMRSAGIPLAKLERMRTDALAAITSEGAIPIESDIDVKKNSVELYVTEKDHIRSANSLKKINWQFPGNLKLIKVPSLSKPQASIYGGLPLQQPKPALCLLSPLDIRCLPNCTSGFSIKSTAAAGGLPVGTRGITTAGHCANVRTYNGTSVIWRRGLDQGAYDIQWHNTPGYTPTNKIQWTGNGQFRYIMGTRPRNLQFVGDYVCKYGNTTGYTCGYIVSKSYQPLSHGTDETGTGTTTHTATFIRVNHGGVGGFPNLSESGDSGGPWFIEGIAYGTHVGEPSSVAPNSYDAFYMAIDYVSGIGVSVLTAP